MALRGRRLNVRGQGAEVRQRSRPVHLRLKFGGLLNQPRRYLRICCCLGEPEKRRRLTHEIPSADHFLISPRFCHPSANYITREVGDSFPGFCMKVNIIFRFVVNRTAFPDLFSFSNFQNSPQTASARSGQCSGSAAGSASMARESEAQSSVSKRS
jgi:hypothetical protein